MKDKDSDENTIHSYTYTCSFGIITALRVSAMMLAIAQSAQTYERTGVIQSLFAADYTRESAKTFHGDPIGNETNFGEIVLSILHTRRRYTTIGTIINNKALPREEIALYCILVNSCVITAVELTS